MAQVENVIPHISQSLFFANMPISVRWITASSQPYFSIIVFCNVTFYEDCNTLILRKRMTVSAALTGFGEVIHNSAAWPQNESDSCLFCLGSVKHPIPPASKRRKWSHMNRLTGTMGLRKSQNILFSFFFFYLNKTYQIGERKNKATVTIKKMSIIHAIYH